MNHRRPVTALFLGLVFMVWTLVFAVVYTVSDMQFQFPETRVAPVKGSLHRPAFQRVAGRLQVAEPVVIFVSGFENGTGGWVERPELIFGTGFENEDFGGFTPVRPPGLIFADGFEGAYFDWSDEAGGEPEHLVGPPPLDVVSLSEYLLPDRWRTVVYLVPRRPAQLLTIVRADGSRWEQPYPAIRTTLWLDQQGIPPCPCLLEVEEGNRLWRATLAAEVW